MDGGGGVDGGDGGGAGGAGVVSACLFIFFEKKVCRVFFGHSAMSLLSARQKTLGKLAFADKGFAEFRLSSVTLGKPFAECFWNFTECPWHLANILYPVVICILISPSCNIISHIYI